MAYNWSLFIQPINICYLSSFKFSGSVVYDSLQSMDCSTPGFPVHHQLPELAQTHVYRVGDPKQPSHPLSSLSHPAFNLSQHQGIFQWISSLHQVIKILEFFNTCIYLASFNYLYLKWLLKFIIFPAVFYFSSCIQLSVSSIYAFSILMNILNNYILSMLLTYYLCLF